MRQGSTAGCWTSPKSPRIRPPDAIAIVGSVRAEITNYSLPLSIDFTVSSGILRKIKNIIRANVTMAKRGSVGWLFILVNLRRAWRSRLHRDYIDHEVHLTCILISH